ncbi:pyridoxamine 5'-phosphate oxidase family protein [Streptomyces flavofungini]|uniref:pyridoxamine 5'-phosphate oxidase family protein n=1 Tax=Streptomyces flavofungini TaxID=68200 RepID=UPI0034DE7933
MDELTRTSEGTRRPHPGDLGRRLRARRAQLGLSRAETAARARMAPGYLRHLEEHATAHPAAGTLAKLADALRTTVTELTGGGAGQPPGRGRVAPGPRFEELSESECRSLLSSHGVGRLALSTGEGLLVVPVNYSVLDGDVVFRTAPGAAPSLADGRQVVFEADHIDDAFSRGWSVLIRGRARTVTDTGEASGLDLRAHSTPWAGGRRDLWVRVTPATVTGRRISR